MVNYKAEVIEEEYVLRLFEKVKDDIRRLNANVLPTIPEQIRDSIIRIVAIEVVATRIVTSAEWN